MFEVYTGRPHAWDMGRKPTVTFNRAEEASLAKMRFQIARTWKFDFHVTIRRVSDGRVWEGFAKFLPDYGFPTRPYARGVEPVLF